MAFGSSVIGGLGGLAGVANRPAFPAAPVAPPPVAPPPVAPPPPNPYASAQSAANLDIQQQVAQLNALLAAQQQAAQQRAQQIYDASLAAAKFLGGLGQNTANLWNQGADTVAGLGRGYSGQAADAANAAAAKVQSDLNSAGSPATAINHGADLASLLGGLGGLMPARGLVSGGIAAGALANSYPSNLINLGRTQAAGVLNTEQQNELPVQQQIATILGTKASLTQKYLAAAQANQQKPNVALSSANGYLTDVYGKPILNAKGKTIPFTPYSKPSTARAQIPKLVKGADGYYYTVTAQGISQTPLKWPKPGGGAGGGNALTVKGNAGHYYLWDKKTNTAYDPVTHQPISDLNAYTGGGGATPGGLPKATSATVTKAASSVANAWLDKTGKTVNLADTVAAYNKTVATANKVTVAEVKALARSGQPKDLQALAALGLGTTRPQVTDIYKNLIQTYPTLTPYQAFSIVAKQYPDWGRQNGPVWFPKGGAARGGAQNASYTANAPAAAIPILDQALKERGVRYVYGGASPQTGFDCSGLIYWAYQQAGKTIPRTSETQFKGGTKVSDISQALPGDLVFYAGSDGTLTNPGHVALYLGGGNVLVAPHSGSYVQIVPANSIGGYAGIRRYSSPSSQAA